MSKRRFMHKEHTRFNPDESTEQGNIPKKEITIIPRNLNQETYLDHLTDEECFISIAIGPAGTGKTLLAVLQGLKYLKEKKVSKLVITRPAVGVDDEKHGFLPGGLDEKLIPWLMPILDIVEKHFGPKMTKKMIEDKTIDVSPLAFMRGRNFEDSWIIFDEAQNSSINSMKAITTRISQGSKLVISGDMNQLDRQFVHNNGLKDFVNRTKSRPSPLIRVVEFNRHDVQRHKVVKEVLGLYGEE